MKPFCVALTGGIGVGKSTTAKMFEVKGAQVVNVDQVGHSILGHWLHNRAVVTNQFPGTAATRRLVAEAAGATINAATTPNSGGAIITKKNIHISKHSINVFLGESHHFIPRVSLFFSVRKCGRFS